MGYNEDDGRTPSTRKGKCKMEYFVWFMVMVGVTLIFGTMGAMVFAKRRLYIYESAKTIVWLDPHGISMVRRTR